MRPLSLSPSLPRTNQSFIRCAHTQRQGLSCPAAPGMNITCICKPCFAANEIEISHASLKCVHLPPPSDLISPHQTATVRLSTPLLPRPAVPPYLLASTSSASPLLSIARGPLHPLHLDRLGLVYSLQSIRSQDRRFLGPPARDGREPSTLLVAVLVVGAAWLRHNLSESERIRRP